MALVLVIVIAALLLAIALPFAFSMGQQEKGVRAMSDRTHARFAAVAARNRAIAVTVPGHEFIEEQAGVGPWSSPWCDTNAEFSAGRADKAPEGFQETGARVADEQGKINVRTAPALTVANLMKRIDPRVEDPRDHLTEHSGRDCAWIAPQTIRKAEPEGSKPDDTWIRVDDATRYSPGARIRVSAKDMPQLGEILEWDVKRGAFRVRGVAEAASVDALMELENRHPVNVNTASREVLAACLEGLSTTRFIDRDRVTREQADRLAEAMVTRTFEDVRDLRSFFREMVHRGEITREDEVAILLNNDCPTWWDLAGTGTVPFTYKSWNLVSVVAKGVQDRPNKAIGGECDLREIVELAPGGVIQWRCKSQFDFEKPIGFANARGFVTGPALLGKGEWPSQDRDKGAWLTGLSGYDVRASWPIAMHFDEDNDGKRTEDGLTFAGMPAFQKGRVLCWPAGSVELWFKAPEKERTIFEAGDEPWSNRIVLNYEIIHEHIGGQYLRLSVKDATLEHGRAEVVHYVKLVPGRWYHIGGYWKTTKMGGLMMTLDGLPVGEYRNSAGGYHPPPGGGEPCSGYRVGSGFAPFTPDSTELPLADPGDAVHLAEFVPKDATSIPVDSGARGFPGGGVLQVGDEAIEYGGHDHLVAADPIDNKDHGSNAFQGCRRGARGTIARDHPKGATVGIWGYSSFLIPATLDYHPAGYDVPSLRFDRIRKCDGKLTSSFGSRAETSTNVLSPDPTDPPVIGFGRGETILAVPAGAAAGFPDRGWLLVGERNPEIVHYDGREASRFIGIERGRFGTPDSGHFIGEPVTLFGFHVTTNAGYSDPAILCLGGEFFGPMVRVDSDGWVALIWNRTAGGREIRPLLRGADWGTGEQAHKKDDDVVPTFALEDQSAGNGDRVTLARDCTQNEDREEANIAGTAWLEGPKLKFEPPALLSPATTTGPAFKIAALDRQVKNELVADSPNNTFRAARLLKFPSGELPCAIPSAFRVGWSVIDGDPSRLDTRADEIRVYDAEYEDRHLVDAILDDQDEIMVDVPLPSPGHPVPPPVVQGRRLTPIDPMGGAVLIDDEIIGYVEFDVAREKIVKCRRGYLGTIARAHARGSRVFPLTMLAVAALQDSVTAGSREFHVNDVAGFPGDGFFLVDRELAGWTKESPRVLGTPAGCNFRGAFGTTPDSHAAGSLLYAMPFRTYDRFTRAADDSDLHCWEGKMRASGAKWKSIRWDEWFAGGGCDIKVFVRFNSAPRWTQLPADPGMARKEAFPKFHEFDDNAGGKLGDRVADEIDVRVMFEYAEGAYSRGEWKESPLFRGMEIEYEQENVVHRHEER
ncbi:MAG: hypothetical protein FD180_1978 [Planctomycetota bacterium]|nr:MAG: hypothetical protein FD180_1978 [Planctomycetota bacterium]